MDAYPYPFKGTEPPPKHLSGMTFYGMYAWDLKLMRPRGLPGLLLVQQGRPVQAAEVRSALQRLPEELARRHSPPEADGYLPYRATQSVENRSAARLRSYNAKRTEDGWLRFYPSPTAHEG
ncbi:hypothetical protein BWQ96_10913 [Gracilariopsis chorda]|uniref:Uncharacterized protein n=1 Tax=Gracilariopsis chorda TaxID=448386 RepID=A0A2V3IBE8_9FLOR|nr:hypothetical protein BWQ96_10913 [Gracilariopsis chorda]|eukprot:PXF39401.1 hypothetical protein BWQ96_10913 [Gracilariopsis chorda]